MIKYFNILYYYIFSYWYNFFGHNNFFLLVHLALLQICKKFATD